MNSPFFEVMSFAELFRAESRGRVGDKSGRALKRRTGSIVGAFSDNGSGTVVTKRDLDNQY